MWRNDEDFTKKISDGLNDEYKEPIRALQAYETMITFMKLYEKLLTFEASLQIQSTKILQGGVFPLSVKTPRGSTIKIEP